MPANERKIFTLSTVLNRVKGIFDEKIHGRFFWMKVEVASINFHNSGHCYVELAETRDGVNIAACKAAIWRSRLAKEKIIDQNKQVKLPIVVQKIAIVGSPRTSGFQDLLKQLSENAQKYHFDIEVFSTHVQGEQAEAEIVSRLRELRNSRFEAIALVRGGGSKLELELFNSYEIAKEIALHDKPVLTGIGHETDINVADIVANVHLKTPTALGSYIVERAREFDVRYTNSYNAIREFKDRYLQELNSKLKLAMQDFTSMSISYAQLRRGELHKQLNRINSITAQHLAEEKRKISVNIKTIQNGAGFLIDSKKRHLLQTMEIINMDSSSMIRMGIDHFDNTMELIVTRAQNQIRESETYYRNVLDLIDVYRPDDVMRKGFAIPRVGGELLKDQELKEGDELEIELYNRILTVVVQNMKTKWKQSSIMKAQQKS